MGPYDKLHILHFTDIHGTAFLFDEIQDEIKQADLIIISGDITHFGDEKKAAKVFDKLSGNARKIFAVSGNCDYDGVTRFLDNNNYLIKNKASAFMGIKWMGISGSLPCPGRTPNEFTEEQLQTILTANSTHLLPDDNLILISHQPPVNTLNDKISDTNHVGSYAIRSFIEEKEPLLCFTGHIHEGIGVDKIKDCAIINPGPFRTGKYASVKIIGENSVEIELKQITV